MDTENKIQQLQQILENVTTQLHQAKQIVTSLTGTDIPTAPQVHAKASELGSTDYYGNSQVIEGVFNGQNMVGPDGKIYTIPANYASKSKLVEGDILKLTILSDGSFVYKQIGPVERNRCVGALVRNEDTGDYAVMVGNRSYKVIKASVTYYHGEPGDEVVILTPEDGNSTWAAVENIMRPGMSIDEDMNEDIQEMLPPGDEAELPAGDEAELPLGDAAELMSSTGSPEAELPKA